MEIKTQLAGWGVQFRSYVIAQNTWSLAQHRSRTTVNGVKAVRLDKHSMRNTTLRKEANGDMVFRLHRTDIVRITPDNVATIHLGGYHTTTTFIRVRQACGVALYTLAPSQFKTQSSNVTRIATESRIGVPYVEGVSIDLSTLVIDPEDVERMVSDRRAEYHTPSKAMAAVLKPLWAKLLPRIKFGVNLGAWAQNAIENYVKMVGKPINQMNVWDRAIYTKPSELTNTIKAFLAGEELSEEEAYALLYSGVKGRYSWRGRRLGDASNPEEITKAFRARIPALRRSLHEVLADENNSYDTKGGQLKGGKFFTAERDMKA